METMRCRLSAEKRSFRLLTANIFILLFAGCRCDDEATFLLFIMLELAGGKSCRLLVFGALVCSYLCGKNVTPSFLPGNQIIGANYQ